MNQSPSSFASPSTCRFTECNWQFLGSSSHQWSAGFLFAGQGSVCLSNAAVWGCPCENPVLHPNDWNFCRGGFFGGCQIITPIDVLRKADLFLRLGCYEVFQERARTDVDHLLALMSRTTSRDLQRFKTWDECVRTPNVWVCSNDTVQAPSLSGAKHATIGHEVNGRVIAQTT